jgi:hypothetical protein
MKTFKQYLGESWWGRPSRILRNLGIIDDPANPKPRPWQNPSPPSQFPGTYDIIDPAGYPEDGWWYNPEINDWDFEPFPDIGGQPRHWYEWDPLKHKWVKSRYHPRHPDFVPSKVDPSNIPPGNGQQINPNPQDPFNVPYLPTFNPSPTVAESKFYKQKFKNTLLEDENNSGGSTTPPPKPPSPPSPTPNLDTVMDNLWRGISNRTLRAVPPPRPPQPPTSWPIRYRQGIFYPGPNGVWIPMGPWPPQGGQIPLPPHIYNNPIQLQLPDGEIVTVTPSAYPKWFMPAQSEPRPTEIAPTVPDFDDPFGITDSIIDNVLQ